MKQITRLSGVALPITMAFLVMITVLAVGLAESMRLERPVASSFIEKARADEFASMGVEEVAAKIRYHTSDPSCYWVSRPGELCVGSSANKLLLSETVSLHSGPADPALTDPALQSPSLNVRLMRPPHDCLINNRKEPDGSIPPLKVGWIYVRKDGSLDTQPDVDLTNPARAFVGRYAYWTDDESSKINLNLAWGRSPGNTNAAGSATKVDLTAIPQMPGPGGSRYIRADAVRNFISTSPDYSTMNRGFFNTPEDARQVTADGVADALIASKFETTHFNHDPNTTFFNEDRIVLTTSPAVAGWTKKGGKWIGKNGEEGENGRPYYIRILTDAAENGALDPGLDANLDDKKITTLLELMTGGKQKGYLTRVDWPFVPGASFQAKYGDSGRLTQLAINIVDYVRAKESPSKLVEPIRGRYIAKGTEVPPQVAGFVKGTLFFDDENCFIGVSRTLCITELGVFLDAADAGKAYPAATKSVVKVEVHLPREYGVDEVDLREVVLWASWAGEESIKEEECSKPHFTGPPFMLRAGEFVVVSRKVPLPGGARPATMRVRAALALGLGSRRLDIVPFLGGGVPGRVVVPVDPAGVAETNITSVEVDDPRVNKYYLAWKMRQAGNSLGRKNDGTMTGGAPISSLGLPPGFSPNQDIDFSGKVTDASLYMPPPAGKSFPRGSGIVESNELGRVVSAGELGYVHTGVEVAAGAGVPWRTLRLQPGSGSNTILPDWALMDLFTPPMMASPNAISVAAPHGTCVGGRVNVNSKVAPFDIERILPLAAALTNVPFEIGNPSPLPPGAIEDADNPTSNTAIQLARNIYYALNQPGRLAANGRQYGHPNLYDSPGEIVEIKGVADKGERSEELVRSVSNLLTSRGGVFMVYAVGQTLKQNGTGVLTVAAESRSQTMLERYVEPQTGSLRLTPIYFRELSR